MTLVCVLAGLFHVVVTILVYLATVRRHELSARRPARRSLGVAAVDVELIRETTTFAFHLHRT